MAEPGWSEQRLREALAGRHVLVTGHTGFKGGWLALWLTRLGARVTGLALPPPAGEPSLFDALTLATLVDHRTADLRDEAAARAALAGVDADLVIHMAAQPLVRLSYEMPADTFLVNVVGTARILDAARAMPSLRGAIVVTSDKCYANREWVWGYRENDRMGGVDPYSASKGCAELLTESYRSCFFAGDAGPALASARAGNVIGGGDWSRDRLMPDLVRSAMAGKPARIRNPASVRPWQHVLEPLAGYLLLAARLLEGGQAASGAWNFGPDADGVADVATVAGEVCRRWGNDASLAVTPETGAPHEASVLRLDSTKAKVSLGWKPRLSLRQAVGMTVDWYRAHGRHADMRAVSLDQIERYAAMTEAPRVAASHVTAIASEAA